MKERKKKKKGEDWANKINISPVFYFPFFKMMKYKWKNVIVIYIFFYLYKKANNLMNFPKKN